MVHHMFRLALGGKLFLAPIKDGPIRALDIGTGTGIWAIEFGESGSKYYSRIANVLHVKYDSG